eukprot:CAMPEP_0117439846 /NCGR_PEP_ID=MMETSP0759-20121206/2772_1 /TAXON_ID=63605 /ORGANISM="Percolomonas cosmopolitus, Strain WS" /LENGTH=251 /DNA_ID=CAMNT_0005231567 /DNA_START=184 /DNA_END=940 /DNA_ORIENTATION=+
MKDVVTLLLENRPEDCLQFMANYFSNVVHGSSYMIRSYRYIKLTERNREAFFDNLVVFFEQFASQFLFAEQLENDSNSSTSGGGANGGTSASTTTTTSGLVHGMGITTNEMSKLIKQVCQDFPQDLFQKVVRVLTQNSSAIHAVSFPEFAAAINACLLYEEFIRHAEQWFQSLDRNKSGRIHHSLFKEHFLAPHMNTTTSVEGEQTAMPQIEKVLKLLKIKAINDGTITFIDLLEALFEMSVVDVPQESVR